MNKKFILSISLMLLVGLAVFVSAEVIPPAPDRIHQVPVECQFSSYSTGEVLGRTCYVEGMPELTFTTTEYHVASMQKDVPYYSSKCSFEVPVNIDTKQDKFIIGNCISSTFKVPRPVSAGIPDDNYFRFCCGTNHPFPYGEVCDNGADIQEEEPVECFAIGLRYKGDYCSTDWSIETQKEIGASCENKFECTSNVCDTGQCVKANFIQKIFNWFGEFSEKDLTQSA